MGGGEAQCGKVPAPRIPLHLYKLLYDHLPRRPLTGRRLLMSARAQLVRPHVHHISHCRSGMECRAHLPHVQFTTINGRRFFPKRRATGRYLVNMSLDRSSWRPIALPNRSDLPCSTPAYESMVCPPNRVLRTACNDAHD